MEPRQERSRATRDRILRSLAGLLQAKTFDQVSVAELTEKARCSMSSFYARFPTKDSLLNAFLDRFFDVSAVKMRAALSGIALSGAGRADRARQLIQLILRSYRDYRGLIRSLILHDRTHPDAGFGNRTRTHKRQVSKEFLTLILDERGVPLNPSARISAGFGLWLVVQAIEQIVLFDDPLMGVGRISERRLVDELTSTLLRAVESSAHMRLTKKTP